MNGPEFASGTASVNGTTLHYERGGEGPTVLLIHGFPQDSYEWVPLWHGEFHMVPDLPETLVHGRGEAYFRYSSTSAPLPTS